MSLEEVLGHDKNGKGLNHIREQEISRNEERKSRYKHSQLKSDYI